MIFLKKKRPLENANVVSVFTYPTSEILSSEQQSRATSGVQVSFTVLLGPLSRPPPPSHPASEVGQGILGLSIYLSSNSDDCSLRGSL